MAYFKFGALIEQLATTATAAGTTTLTNTSRTFQQFTGTTTQTVVLPNATTMKAGQKFVIQNRSTGALTVNKNGGAFLAYVLPDSERAFQVTDVSTSAGVWDTTTGVGGVNVAPLRMYANSTPDAKLYFSAAQATALDGSAVAIPAVSSTTPSFVASTINMQTQATTGGTFSIVWPTSTVGRFRRLAFTLSAAGTMTGTFSSEQLTVGALPDAGTLYSTSGIPIGYVDLEATATTPAFKTAGSATNVVEPVVSGTSRIFNLATVAGIPLDTSVFVTAASLNETLFAAILNGDIVRPATVTNAKLANMATQTIKGRTTAGAGDPEDLTATQATAILNAFTGDSGSGGVKGLVPAPAAGDAAANKFLKANGTWQAVTGGGLINTAFTSSTTWNVPAGVTSIFVTVMGAGGGGAGGTNGSGGFHGGGGGGGGGGGVISMPLIVTPGETLTITAPAGGGGGGSTANGTAGTASSISGSFGIVRARGGSGGSAGGATTGGSGAAFSSTAGGTISGGGTGGNGGQSGVSAGGSGGGGDSGYRANGGGGGSPQGGGGGGGGGAGGGNGGAGGTGRAEGSGAGGSAGGAGSNGGGGGGGGGGALGFPGLSGGAGGNGRIEICY